MSSEIRIGNDSSGLLLKESPSLDSGSLPSLTYDICTGEVKYRNITGGGQTYNFANGITTLGDGSIGLGGTLINSTTLSGTSDLNIQTLGGVFINLQDGAKYNTMNIYNPSDNALIDFSVGDSVDYAGFKLDTSGLIYSDDYSSRNETNDRWIPDKGYVDTHGGGTSYNFANGITTLSDGSIGLGGNIIQETSININDNIFSISSNDGSTYIQIQNNSIILTTDNYIKTYITVQDNYAQMTTYSAEIVIQDNFITIDYDKDFVITDSSTTPAGLQYGADYSATFTDRSLVDKGYVDSLLTFNPSDGIFDWDGCTYIPFESYTIGKFYSGTIDPSTTTRLNFDGIFYAKQLNSRANSGDGLLATSISGNGIQAVSNTNLAGLFNIGSGNTGNIVNFQKNSVIKALISNKGNYEFIIGDSSTFVVSPGILKDFYTDVINSSTNESDLYTYIIPANALNLNGDKIEALFYGTFDSATSNNSIIKLYFAESQLNGSLQPDAALIDYWSVKVLIIRVDVSTLRCTSELEYNSLGTGKKYLQTEELISKNCASTNILKITGKLAADAGGIITAKMGYIEYKPASIN